MSVSISYISAERFWGHGKPAPAGVHISTNVNIVGIEPKDEKLAAVPFVVTIGYTPSIAQISLKGQVILPGNPGELEKIQDDYKKRHAPPPQLLQTITNVSLIEATVLSRSLDIPPPIPLPHVSPPRERKEGEKLSYIG